MYVSVCVYMFLSVVCYHSKFLAHCSGKSATIKALLESVRTTSILLPQKLSFYLLCGIPKGGSWVFLDYQRANEFDYWLITSVLYVLVLHMFSESFSTLLTSHLFITFVTIEITSRFILLSSQ